MKAIETIGLTKTYGTKVAVNALNLTVEKGELFALLGVNGAGKTTTIKMLCCLSKPTDGDALLLGDSIVHHPAKVKQKINVSPQETAVAPNLSVEENLEMIAGIYANNRIDASKRSKAMIESFGLGEVARDRAKSLSGGWQRRLSIAMALISEPEILFLDEPTLGLDVLARRELWSIIKRLKGNITIVLTTHYLEEVEALADRVAIMTKGQIKAMGTVEELLAQTGTARLEDAFVSLSSESGVTI